MCKNKQTYVATSLCVQDLIQSLYIDAELFGKFALAVFFSLPTLWRQQKSSCVDGVL